jgi:hypothetical protein
MDVRRLAPGHRAPEGTDRIRLTANGKGQIEVTAWVGSVNATAQPIGTYPTVNDAQRAAFHWAVGRVGLLYIEMPDATGHKGQKRPADVISNAVDVG